MLISIIVIVIIIAKQVLTADEGPVLWVGDTQLLNLRHVVSQSSGSEQSDHNMMHKRNYNNVSWIYSIFFFNLVF